MEQVSPTRMNLLLKRRQIKIAQQGAALLKNKRDALLNEFMGLIKPLLEDRRKLDRRLRQALVYLAKTMGVDGPETLESVALASPPAPPLKVEEKRVWGVKLLDLEAPEMVRSPLQRGYAPVSVSARVDMTAEAFEEVIDLIIQAAPKEIRLKRLGEEIKKTTRRLNALEQKRIPELKAQVAFIRQVLEDREREDKFRMKKLKAKGGEGHGA